MTSHDIYWRPLQGRARITYTLHSLADHHPIPFLTGTDGLTWLQRRRMSNAYAKKIMPTPAQLVDARIRLEEFSAKQRAAAQAEEVRRSA